MVQKSEHQLAPGPETITLVAAAMLGQAGHGPLKGVAVGVDGRWQQMADMRVWFAALKACRDPVNLPNAVDVHMHTALPAVWQKRSFSPDI